MPRRDGTGPAGQGSGGGGGRQSRMGAGSGRGRRAHTDYCECPNCGNRVPHQVGKPCNQEKCPQCGSAMIRP